MITEFIAEINILFTSTLISTNNKSISTEQNQVPHKWPSNTLLIAADSIMSNLDEKKLSRHMNVKVRSIAGSSIADMYSYLQPLLIKESKYVLLHVSANDVNKNTISDVINNILQLKHYVESKLPKCVVYISSPTVRTDNLKANTILKNVTGKLKRLQIPIMDNSNIQPEQLGKKGSHLNSRGNAKRISSHLLGVFSCGGKKGSYIEPNSNFPVYISQPDPNDAHYPPRSTPKSSFIGRRYSNSSVNTDMVLPGSSVNLLQMNINPVIKLAYP